MGTAASPLSVEVTLPVDDPTAQLTPGRDAWDPDTWTVNRVQWRAWASRGLHPEVADGVTVSVTAYTRHAGPRASNQSWHLTPETVHPDLRNGAPPAWVPPAPAWFDQVVEEMRATTGTL